MASALQILLVVAVFVLGFTSAARSSNFERIKHEKKKINGGFRVDLLHPASRAVDTSNTTRSERLAKLIAKSNARVHWMVNRRETKLLSASGNYESPLTPNGGGYLMQISMGTPLQRFYAIADTGSDLVWVQSDPCNSCNGAIFHPRSSTTYRPVACHSQLCSDLPDFTCGRGGVCEYFYQYGSGDTGGIFATETITLQNTAGAATRFPSFAVGCGTNSDGFEGFQGLVGLGQGPISFTSQLATAIDQKFSYCLVDYSSEDSSPLFFGAAAALRGGYGSIQSTPIVLSHTYDTYYVVNVKGMSVNGIQLGNPGTTILDSGTTLTYVPMELYTAIRNQFTTLVKLPQADGSSLGLDLCFDTRNSRDYNFPSMFIEFDGATMSLPSSNYFLAVDDSGYTKCLAMATSEGLPVSIIGNIMQQGYHILFDRGASEISFVPENCAMLK